MEDLKSCKLSEVPKISLLIFASQCPKRPDETENLVGIAIEQP